MEKWVFMGILQMKRVKGENRFVPGFLANEGFNGFNDF